jgi:hypothetical protein
MNLNLAFLISLAITVLIYLLRGFAIITFIPGGIIWFLMLVTLGLGIWLGVEKTRRF